MTRQLTQTLHHHARDVYMVRFIAIIASIMLTSCKMAHELMGTCLPYTRGFSEPFAAWGNTPL